MQSIPTSQGPESGCNNHCAISADVLGQNILVVIVYRSNLAFAQWLLTETCVVLTLAAELIRSTDWFRSLHPSAGPPPLDYHWSKADQAVCLELCPAPGPGSVPESCAPYYSSALLPPCFISDLTT